MGRDARQQGGLEDSGQGWGTVLQGEWQFGGPV